MTAPTVKGRVHLLDELRGLVVLLMVFYHAVYDLKFLFGYKVAFFYSTGMEWLRLFIVCQFIVIAGVMCRYSRNNLRRGAHCFGAAMLLTAGTMLFMPSQRIVFGILHLLGSSMLLFAVGRPLFDKLPPLPGMAVSLALFFFAKPVPYGYFGFWGKTLVKLPPALYEAGWLFPLGIHGRFFRSADYYPLLPWFFLFLMGAYFGIYFRRGDAPAWMYRPHLPALAKVGRRAMLVYLLHQPVIYALLYVITAALR